MRKFILFEKTKKIRLRIVILLIVGIIVIPTWAFLDSIHYKVGDWFWVATSGLHPKVVNFNEYKNEFDLIVNEIDRFVDEHPNFFEEFNGDCTVKDEGLVFYKIGFPYPESQVLWPVSTDEWKNVGNHMKAFSNNYYYSGISLCRDYQNYIFFRSGEMAICFLVYTRGEKPNKLIESYWEKFNYVHTGKVAHGWYDILPNEQKTTFNH